MSKETLFHVRFMGENQRQYDVYAEEVFQGELYGFVVLRGLVFNKSSSLVVDPGEEKLKSEFEGVEQTMVPMHAVIRIDEVKKQGQAKVTEAKGEGGVVTAFPGSIYTPRKDS